MRFRRVNTNLILNVTNPEALALFEGNGAYEVIEDVKKVEPVIEKKPIKKPTKKVVK